MSSSNLKTTCKTSTPPVMCACRQGAKKRLVLSLQQPASNGRALVAKLPDFRGTQTLTQTFQGEIVGPFSTKNSSTPSLQPWASDPHASAFRTTILWHTPRPLLLNLLRASASLWRPKRSRSARGAQLGGSRCRRRPAPGTGEDVLFQQASLGKGTLASIDKTCVG